MTTIMESSRYNSSWKDEFIQSLDLRDHREQIHSEIIQFYTHLASRSPHEPASSIPSTPITETPTSTSTSETSLRVDLSKAQTLVANLTAEASTLRTRLTTLESTTTTQATQIRKLTEDLAYASRKVRDLTEESRISRKMYQDCQDEMLAQQIQINMADQAADALRVENEMLVERWMKEKGRKADEMNQEFEKVDLHAK